MRMNTVNETVQTTMGLGLIALLLTSLYGYVINVVNVFQADFTNFTILLAMQLVGIVVGPLGAILGWLV